MNGVAPQRLEVGGRDLGPGGASTRNFGCSQLIVGDTSQGSVVQLVDLWFNGNRGANGEAEALYLYGLAGQGLQLLSGSKLILNGLKCYAAVNGQMTDLETLIPTGQDVVAFDQGFIARTAGPAITNMTPQRRMAGLLDHVDVSFDIAIAPASFAAADVSIVGPGGVVPVSGVAQVASTTWQISFPAQSLDGAYDITVGPHVTDLTGILAGMDQDQDGSVGEATDAFHGQVTLDTTGPVVISAVALNNGTLVSVIFNENVDLASATALSNYRVNGMVPSQAMHPPEDAIADSVVGWVPGAQGSNHWYYGWYYGYWNLSAAGGAPYRPAEFNTTDPNWSFDGASWVLGPGDPPWDTIGQTLWHPNGDDYGPVHWVIRRWVSPQNGDLTIRLQFSKNNSNGGNGTTLRVFHNGSEQFSRTISYWDRSGFDTYMTVSGVASGDTIDFALDPLGTDGTRNCDWDGSYFKAMIYEGATPAAPGVDQLPARHVLLRVDPLIGDSFTLETANLRDTLGNTSSNLTSTGTILSVQAADLGWPGSDPALLGSVYTYNGADFDVTAGGSDFWGNEDRGYFVYESRTGDFDVRVRVQGWSGGNCDTQMGLAVRNDLDPYGMMLFNGVRGCGDWLYRGVRSSRNTGMDWWNYRNPVPSPPWLRLQRQGDTFSLYWGRDGANWNLAEQRSPGFNQTVLVGLAATAWDNNPNNPVRVQFRDYSDLSPVFVENPTNQSAASGQDVSFGVTVRGLPPLHYQWLFNGMDCGGPDANVLVLRQVTPINAGEYRVVVSNAYGTATSAVAFLSVDGVGGLAGFEGDVVPRPLGNNLVTVSDWVEVGRIVAGLDEVLSAGEFARVDCAPRTNKLEGTLPLGDGILTVADWTQAGRYAAGLDPLTPVGGPTMPIQLAGFSGASGGQRNAAAKATVNAPVVRTRALTVAAGQIFEVQVELAAQGRGNALGFSLAFDPRQLSFAGASLDPAAGLAYFHVNSNKAGLGQVGFVLAKPIGQSFAAGTAELFRVRFAAGGATGTARLDFGDVPVVREVADANAEVQPARFAAGAVRIVKAGRLALTVQRGRCSLSLSGEAGVAYILETSSDLAHWTPVSTHTLGEGTPAVVSPEDAPGPCRFYRLVPQP
jgi:hypothetical protein